MDPEFLCDKKTAPPESDLLAALQEPYGPHFLPVYMGRQGVASITGQLENMVC